MNWPSTPVDARAWTEAGKRLQSEELSLLSLWGEPRIAHMAVIDPSGRPSVLHLPCADNCVPSIGALHAPAIRTGAATRQRRRSSR